VKLRNLSPVTSALVSLFFVVGILVVDLTKARIVPATEAQGRSHAEAITTSVAVAFARVKGSKVVAKDVVVNGVATDAVLNGKVAVVNSVVVSDGGIGFDGIIVNGDSPTPPRFDGIIVNGGSAINTDGIIVNGGSPTQGGAVVGGDITAAGDLQITGGVVSGDNVCVTDGVIRGHNLQVSGAVVSGKDLKISGATIAAHGR